MPDQTDEGPLAATAETGMVLIKAIFTEVFKQLQAIIDGKNVIEIPVFQP